MSKVSDNREWFEDFYCCFGPQGVLALAFWFGAHFAEEIRARYGSYPILEVVGAPGTGKSVLLEFLWKLIGRSGYEGFCPAYLRSDQVTMQLSIAFNRPVVLIDEDGARDRQKGDFEWDRLKASYHGWRAAHGSEFPFRGAMVISRFSGDARSQWLMRTVTADLNDLIRTPESRDAALRLESWRAADVLTQAAHRFDDMILCLELAIPHHEKRIQSLIGTTGVDRIVKNHAQMMALVDMLEGLVPFHPSVRGKINDFISETAAKKYARIHGNGDALSSNELAGGGA